MDDAGVVRGPRPAAICRAIGMTLGQRQAAGLLQDLERSSPSM